MRKMSIRVFAHSSLVVRPEIRVARNGADGMSEYLVLIYGNEKSMEEAGQAGYDAMMAGHAAFGEKNGPALRGGERAAANNECDLAAS